MNYNEPHELHHFNPKFIQRSDKKITSMYTGEMVAYWKYIYTDYLSKPDSYCLKPYEEGHYWISFWAVSLITNIHRLQDLKEILDLNEL